MRIDRRRFVAGMGALGLIPSAALGASGAGDPTLAETARESLGSLGGQIAQAGAEALLSWAGTQAFNYIFGLNGDPIAEQLDKIIALEYQILSALKDVETETDWQGAVTRIQPAVSTINAFFQSVKDNVTAPRPAAAIALQLKILAQDSSGVKSALSVIHEELVGNNPIAPGTPGLLQLWRNKNWTIAARPNNNVDPYTYVRNMHNYLRSVYLLQMKGLTLYVSAALASDPQTRKLALPTAKMVYDNMSKQSDLLYDAVGHGCDLFNDYAPRPEFSGLPAGFTSANLTPGFELTTAIDGVTYLLAGHGSTTGGDQAGPTDAFPEKVLKNPKASDWSTEWYLRGNNQVSCYPLIQRLTGTRDRRIHELNLQLRLLPDNAVEFAEWETSLDPEPLEVEMPGNNSTVRTQFNIRPTGNYFILWGFNNLVSRYTRLGNGAPARCL